MRGGEERGVTGEGRAGRGGQWQGEGRGRGRGGGEGQDGTGTGKGRRGVCGRVRESKSVVQKSAHRENGRSND